MKLARSAHGARSLPARFREASRRGVWSTSQVTTPSQRRDSCSCGTHENRDLGGKNVFWGQLPPGREKGRLSITVWQEVTCVNFGDPWASGPDANIPLDRPIQRAQTARERQFVSPFSPPNPPNTARFVLEIREGWRAPLATLTRSSSTATIHGGDDPNRLAAPISDRDTPSRHLRNGLPTGLRGRPLTGHPEPLDSTARPPVRCRS